MKISRDEHATCTCICIWIWILQHSSIFIDLSCYHFCLTRFGLVFMIFFWTSSQFLVHIGECRLSYCIEKNFSNSLQLFIVFFECWALTMTSKKSALLCILIMSSQLQNCLNSHWSNPSYWLIIDTAYHVYTFYHLPRLSRRNMGLG